MKIGSEDGAGSRLLKGAFLGVALIAAATPVQAQLTGIVNYAIPVGGEMPATHLVGEFGRGLNEDSGKMNAFAVAAGRTGIGGRGSAFVGASMVDSDPDSEYSFGVVGAVGVTQPAAPTQISVQAGVGYMSPVEDVTIWTVPVGVALMRAMPQGSGTFDYWVMPRVHMSRVAVSGFDSEMDTNFGASGGLGFTTASGFGFHAAIDWLSVDGGSPLTGGAGVHFVIP
ncbi:MAG: hypothetical protein AB7T31_12895 [Gemmatimonadales bacterium]